MAQTPQYPPAPPPPPPPPPQAFDTASADGTGPDPLVPEPTDTEVTGIHRGDPNPDPQRAALVTQWTQEVTSAKEHWKDVFDNMRDCEDFAAGKQWPGEDPKNFYDNRYVVNITLRHIAQRTAVLYAKNPTAVARVRKRMENTVWDGTLAQLQQAMQGAQMGDPTAIAIIQDAENVKTVTASKKRIAKTLELLYDYNVDEQPVPFKDMMKLVVRRAATTGVGYIKLTFQRATEKRPEVEAQIATLMQRLSHIQRLAADMHEGDYSGSDAEAEQLRLNIQALQKNVEIILREGLLFDYPDSTALIPDPCCTRLSNFLGAGWVAQEYLLTCDRVKEIYGIDVGSSYRAHYQDRGRSQARVFYPPQGKSDDKQAYCCVWEIWSKDDQMQFVVCDGYPDFLQEPAEPDTWIERFWPWFVLVLNETVKDGEIYPPSDVMLIRHQQMEINRAREGLREHRVSNRPGTAVAAGMLDEEDRNKMQKRASMDVVELNALAPGQKIDDVLQPLKGPPIDPALYDVGPAYEDILRVVGEQEANLGGTAGATATETSVAEASRMSAQQSNVDDLDGLLTDLARAGGQILMDQVSEQTVKQVVGPGAMWPKLSRPEIAREIFLETQAGSAGRPNRAIELQQFQQLAPILLQIPGVSPQWLASEAIRRMDDDIDLDDAFTEGLPSMQAINSMLTKGAGGPPAGGGPPAPQPNAPSMQGPAGASNAPQQPQPGGMEPRLPPDTPIEGLPPQQVNPSLRNLHARA